MIGRNETTPVAAQVLPPELTGHRAFARVFRPGSLTLGLITPLEGYPDSAMPTLVDHAQLARRADQLGFAALWLRDVPFYDPSFGDVGQIIDPMVYAGWLAAITTNIAIGTAGIVLPLRDPVIVAKQATSVDQLLGGRFLLGEAGGDRSAEFPAFGLPYSERAERYQEAHALIRSLTSESFPRHATTRFGNLVGSLDLIPKPSAARLPQIAIGRSGQTIEWIAANMDAWIWHGIDASSMADILPRWREACRGEFFKPYGYGTLFDLVENPDSPVEGGRVLRGGRNALIALWEQQETAGVSHIALNLKQSRRPAIDIIEELAEHVLQRFPAHRVEAGS